MKNILIIIFVLIFCDIKARESDDIFKISYNDSSFLRFHINNCDDTIQFRFLYFSYFPAKQVKNDISFNKDTIFIYKICINHPVTISFIFKNKLFSCCYSIPRDTLDIFLSLDSSKNVRYKGRTAEISNYLTKGKFRIASFPEKTEDILTYNKKIDSITQLKINKLVDFDKSEKLPNWYVEFEKQNIELEGECVKIDQFTQRLDFYKQYIPNSIDFYEKNKINLDNQNAIFCENYFHVLSSFRSSKYDTLLRKVNVNDSIFLQYTIDNINFAKKYLHHNLSYFIAAKISILLSSKKIANQTNIQTYISKIDSLIANSKKLITDTVIFNQLLNYRNEQISIVEKITKLNAGNKAPGFTLLSIDGKYIKLSDFKGQYVVLNFWATWCAPCIESITEKNELFQKYNKKSVNFVNICLDSNNKSWRKIITDKNFYGNQLICMGDWNNVLSNNYNINGIPHFTLIDKNGNVVSNKIKNCKELEGLLKSIID